MESIILMCFTIFSSLSLNNCNKIDINNQVEVWLTVSSLVGHNKQTNQSFQRQLQLNWRNIYNHNEDQWIGLFSEEPINEKIEKRGREYSIESISISGQSIGTHRTSIQFPHQKFSKSNLTSKCLMYWIAYIRLNRIVAKNCIKSNPFWMDESLEKIGDKSLLQIMIPGTHNSASFDRFDPKDNILRKYTLCQDENVWNQLVYGIRFLDLRVSYERVKGKKYKLWTVHGPIRMKETLESILLQVKDFIQIASKEIVIIDFHRFEKGFNTKELSPAMIRKRHQQVVALILRHLKEYLVPFKMGLYSTINELISENKRIIVGYASNNYNESEFLFPQTKHLWANTDSLNELNSYLNRTICESYPNILHSAMAHLTPDRIGLISDRYNGLRTMAQTVNHNITESFRNQWSKCANVVASDYFLGNNLIEIAIKSNVEIRD